MKMTTLQNNNKSCSFFERKKPYNKFFMWDSRTSSFINPFLESNETHKYWNTGLNSMHIYALNLNAIVRNRKRD